MQNVIEIECPTELMIGLHDLLADWELAANGKKPFPIKGLDQ